MIGEKIRYFREKEGLTQQEMAEKLFLSDRAVGHYETGKRTPSIETLKEMSKLLKVELDDFFKDETKRLMQLQYTLRECKSMLYTHGSYYVYDELEPKHFMMTVESDRYFIQLNREFRGSPMTYLVWLLDGFYLIPLKSQWQDGADEIFIDTSEIKRVSKSDVDYIQKASGRSYIKSQNERSFAESIYKSLFDTMDFTISSDYEEDSLEEFMVYETEGLFAFDYENECFYAKNKKGIFKVYFRDGDYDEYNFLEVDTLYLDERVYLSTKETEELHQYVSLKDKEAKLLLNEFENAETLDTRKELGEKYRKNVAFVDKMKRILEVSEEIDFPFLPTEEEVKAERKSEEEKKKQARNQMNLDGIDTSKNNKVLFLNKSSIFYYAIYSHMVEQAEYQLIKSFDSGEVFMTRFKELLGTDYKPDIVLLNIYDKEEMLDVIKQIREVTVSVKIVILGSLFPKNDIINFLETGVNHMIATPCHAEQMKEIFDKVLHPKV